MPTYLLHGFRWDRVSIRVHIVVHDLEDAAPEWIVAPATSVTLLNSFYTLFDFLPPSNPPPASYPLASAADKVVVEDGTDNGTRTLKDAPTGSIGSLKELVRRPISGTKDRERDSNSDSGRENQKQRPISTPSTTAKATMAKSPAKPDKKPTFNDWSAVKLVEQFDPDDLASVSQPHAYVADYMIEVPLGVSITEEMAKYEAKIKEEEASLSLPSTPGTTGDGTNTNTGNEKGGLSTPPLSAREIRRRSRRLGWFEKLRDGLQKGEDIGWFVVVCGDEERKAPSVDMTEGESSGSEELEKRPRSAGLIRGFFGKRRSVQQEE
ncbi:hypothetical protein ONS95_001183 [Cadophora gregata]|uniref:uncharacterized protein n=1 Tax=Cadophora gregata TaxID=51156 RepID=UPI0026DD9A59|nr:uncharacterized protein ONS95_001183 [Cadophora gregata]KAK0102011.1 hypothetical protein ONS96_005979 [Cadophora gregata f. sp. sojae]KAK0129248.1 hypothetical protein ONS95_001183 [Cadophora gregata]